MRIGVTNFSGTRLEQKAEVCSEYKSKARGEGIQGQQLLACEDSPRDSPAMAALKQFLFVFALFFGERLAIGVLNKEYTIPGADTAM